MQPDQSINSLTSPTNHAASLDLQLDSPDLRIIDAVFRASPDVILVINRAGQYIYVGVTASRLVGLSPEAMLGKTFADLGVAPEQNAKLAAMREQVFITEQPVNGELNLPTINGLRDFDFTFSPVQDAEGHTQAILCIARDVTEQKRFEEERCYVMAGARCLLWHADVWEKGDPRYLRWEARIPDQEAAQHFLPLDIRAGETYITANYRSRLPEDRDACDLLGAAAIRAGRSYQQEYRCIDADGTVHWLHEDMSVETVEPGKHWRVIAVCTDITPQKLAGQALQAAYSQTVEILESITDAFYAVDAGFNFTYINRKTEELWGRSREELIGRNCWTLFPHTVGSHTYREHLHAATERRPVHYETISPIVGKWIEVSIYPTSGGGLAVYFQDISERKRAQAEIEALNERLRRAMQETHHRVKNNLQIISAMLDMAQMEHEDALPMADVKRVQQQIMTLAHIHDILTHNSGIAREPTDEVSVRAMLTRLLSMLKTSADRYRFEQEIEDVCLSVQQATCLGLVLNELTSNALKH